MLMLPFCVRGCHPKVLEVPGMCRSSPWGSHSLTPSSSMSNYGYPHSSPLGLTQEDEEMKLRLPFLRLSPGQNCRFYPKQVNLENLLWPEANHHVWQGHSEEVNIELACPHSSLHSGMLWRLVRALGISGCLWPFWNQASLWATSMPNNFPVPASGRWGHWVPERIQDLPKVTRSRTD